MPRTAHIEAQIDRAKNRRDAFEKAEGECQTAVEAAVALLAKVVGATDKERNNAVDAIWETLADLTSDARTSVERDITNLEEQLSDIEYRDVRRSAPIVL